ncbi:MAG: hypothetical protein ACPGVU_12980 [Limisphaerales bacterium]
MKAFHALLKHPWTTLIVGLILIGSSGYEVYEAFQEAEEMKIGGHHGVLTYGIIHSLKAIPEIFEGAEEVGL